MLIYIFRSTVTKAAAKIHDETKVDNTLYDQNLELQTEPLSASVQLSFKLNFQLNTFTADREQLIVR